MITYKIAPLQPRLPSARRRPFWPRRRRRPSLTGFQTGSGQTGLSRKDQKSLTCCHSLLCVRTYCYILYHFATCFIFCHILSWPRRRMRPSCRGPLERPPLP